MALENEGTIAFWLKHQHSDWQSNSNGYRFAPFSAHDISTVVVKHPNKTLEIVIVGPLYRTSVFITTKFPQIIKHQDLHVAITWKIPVMTLYLNGEQIQKIEVESIKKTTLSVTIRSSEQEIPLHKVGELLEHLGSVFNAISAFLDTPDSTSLRSVLEYGLDRSKFNLIEGGSGSFKGILSGSQKVFEFVKDKFGIFLAVFTGNTRRLAEAYVSGKEAETEIARQKANQEKLETLEKAMNIAERLGQQLADSRTDISSREKQELSKQYFLPPLQEIANTLFENGMTLTIEPPDGD